MRRVKQADIAKKLGISIATVSRALKNRIEISEEVREKVRQVAKELSYQPNFMASNLRAQKNFVIGVIIPKIVHEYMASIIKGISEEAHSSPYQLMIHLTNDSYQKEVKAMELFANGMVDGVLICATNETIYTEHFDILRENNIPFVMFDKDIQKLQAPKVVVDDFSGALRAVEHLIEQGYQHIAHLQDNMVSHGSQKRLKGYYSALKRHKLTKNSEYVVQLSSISIDESRRVTEDLLKTHPEIDAIFAITDEIAVGALQAAQQAGKKIPEEFGVIGFSNWQISRVVQPSLSTIAQPGTEVGRTAFRLLMHHIENPRYFQDNFPVKILKTKLLVRESTDRKIGLAQK
jgi:LacI family transcriptional regulator